jgi:hypothetical protein
MSDGTDGALAPNRRPARASDCQRPVVGGQSIRTSRLVS